MDIILSLITPIIISLSFYPFISNRNFFKNLPFGLKYSFSLAFAMSMIVIILSICGLLFKSGFHIVSYFIWIFMFLSFLVFLSKMNRHIFLDLHKRLYHIIQNRITLFFSVLLLIFLSIFLLRPIADADIVDSYLPIARSIALKDTVPAHNYFDNRPFIIPPVGGPVIFAFYYVLTRDLSKEIFRYINIPVFIGFLIISYYLLKQYLSKELAMTGILLLLSFSAVEDMIFTAGLYPDFLFAFLSVLCFWLITTLEKNVKEKIKYILIGLFLATLLLLKYQAIFMYIIVFIFMSSAFIRSRWKFIIVPLSLIPFWFRSAYLHGAFNSPNKINYIVFISLFSICLILLLSRHHFPKISGLSLLITGFISLFGFIFIVHNLYIFHGLSENTPSYQWAVKIERNFGNTSEGGTSLEDWSLFLSPTLALFWLIPKIVGFIYSFFNRRLIVPLFIFIVWYSYWVIYLSSSDTKWLMPVLPLISLFAITGLKAIFNKIETVQKMVLTSLPFMILSSRYIFWNLGAEKFGANNLRSGVDSLTSIPILPHNFPLTKTSGIILDKLISGFQNWAVPNTIKEIYLLTAREGIQQKDLPQLLLTGGIFFILIFMITKIFQQAKLNYIIPIFLIAVYFYIILSVSGGNPLAFSDAEQDKLFDYWGQHSQIVPFLKKHAKSNDNILLFSIPTGLSYYSNLKVYNLEYGGGLEMLQPIFEETDQYKIYQFLKERNFRYIIIREYSTSLIKFNHLKKSTHIFNILNNRNFTKENIIPTDGNYYRMYELI